MYVTTVDPTNPLAVPAYDGPAADAHRTLDPSRHECTFERYDGTTGSGTLVIEPGTSYLLPTATAPWSDPYSNHYAELVAATDVTIGADVMLVPFTDYRVEDASGYEEDEMDPVGTVTAATNIDDDRPVYGRVESVEPVDGGRVKVTIADIPCPPWTFSVPAGARFYSNLR